MYEVLAGYDGAKGNGSEGCEKEGSKRGGSERAGSEREGDEREGNEGKRGKIGESGAKERDINLITRDSASFQKGISITSVRMSKGLELVGAASGRKSGFRNERQWDRKENTG